MQLTELGAHRHTVATRSGEIGDIDIVGRVAPSGHANAGHTYLWRHVIGTLAIQRRCIAVDGARLFFPEERPMDLVSIT
jgi:hypothetical protein